MIIHLLIALHENEGSVAAESILFLLMNEPTLILLVFNFAMVSRDCLELNLYISSVRSSN